MTVPAQATLFNESNANGVTTEFPYGFKIASANDITVELDGVVTTTGFTVTGVGNANGGSIVFSVAPANGVTVLRYLDSELSRSEDYQQLGDFNSDVVDLDFDRIWLALQSIALKLSLCVRAPISSASGVLPDPVPYALIGWNADGTGFQNADLTYSTALATDLASSAAGKGAELIAYMPAGVGAVSTDVHSALREIVSVVNFMTAEDRTANYLAPGSVDLTYAINAAFSYLRTLIVKANGITQGESVKLVFGKPGSVLKVTGSINATGLKGLNVVIDGGGAVILGACAGLPVFDMRNSRWYSINNLSIWGDVTNTPSYGIVTGRTLLAGSSAGDGSFNDCAIHGYFTKACLYNFTSETVQYRHCRFYNSYVGTGANCIVMDGVNNYNVPSAFETQLNSVNTPVSFNENNFYGCDFRRVGSTGTDSCIRYIGFASRHAFIMSYAANDAGDIVELYRPQAALPCSDLILDIHAEVDNGSSGVRNLLLVDTANATATVSMYGLKIRDHAPQCRNAMIDTTGGTQVVTFDASEIDCGDPSNVIPVFGSTSAAGKLLFSGVIKWPSSKALSFGNGYVNGDIYVKDTTTVTATVGAYQLIRRPSATASRLHDFKGYLRATGTGDGSSPANYVELEGSQAGAGVAVVAGGTDSNIDLSLTPKGTGNLKFGTHTGSADAPVSGYITIKDSAGTVRKLAVIS